MAAVASKKIKQKFFRVNKLGKYEEIAYDL